MKNLKLLFAGTPAFGLPCLNALYHSPHELLAVYTQPDRPAGRGRKLQASSVKDWALKHHIPTVQPIDFKNQTTLDELASFEADLIVVIAYGLILPRVVLEMPRLGCINVHASLLPRWRGASPIQQAILHGDNKTGITIMQMDIGMDTGDMLKKASCEIGDASTSELHDKLAQMAVTPLLETLDALTDQSIISEKQNNALATYAPKIKKDDAAIDWKKSAVDILRQIRAYNPWPIAYTNAGDTSLRIYEAQLTNQTHQQPPGTVISIQKEGMLVATGDNPLLIKRLQFPGSNTLSVADWLHSGQHNRYINMVFT